jgi:hypothetical protein
MIDILSSYSAISISEKIIYRMQLLFVDLESIVTNTNSMKKYSKSSTENLRKNESSVK